MAFNTLYFTALPVPLHQDYSFKAESQREPPQSLIPCSQSPFVLYLQHSYFNPFPFSLTALNNKETISKITQTKLTQLTSDI